MSVIARVARRLRWRIEGTLMSVGLDSVMQHPKTGSGVLLFHGVRLLARRRSQMPAGHSRRRPSAQFRRSRYLLIPRIMASVTHWERTLPTNAPIAPRLLSKTTETPRLTAAPTRLIMTTALSRPSRKSR